MSKKKYGFHRANSASWWKHMKEYKRTFWKHIRKHWKLVNEGHDTNKM